MCDGRITRRWDKSEAHGTSYPQRRYRQTQTPGFVVDAHRLLIEPLGFFPFMTGTCLVCFRTKEGYLSFRLCPQAFYWTGRTGEMDIEKYLPQLMAEKDSLDPSFQQSLRLLDQGLSRCIPVKLRRTSFTQCFVYLAYYWLKSKIVDDDFITWFATYFIFASMNILTYGLLNVITSILYLSVGMHQTRSTCT